MAPQDLSPYDRRLTDELPGLIKRAIKEVVHESLSDPDLVEGFWKRGYIEFTNHVSTGASQWVGKRLLTALVTALFVFAVGYLAKNGALK